MARKMIAFRTGPHTPSADPYTMFALKIATNAQAVLTQVNLRPKGTTAAALPFEIWLIKADDVANMAQNSTGIKYVNGMGGTGAIQTQLWDRDTGEPTYTVTEPQAVIDCHNQAQKIWTPGNPFREFKMQSGEIWAFRSNGGLQGTAIEIEGYIEE